MRFNLHFYIALIVIFNSLAGDRVIGQDYAASSVLKNGNWYVVKVVEEGVVRINYSDLEEIGLGGSVPAVYGNNFGLLSYKNDDPYPDDLKPVKTYVELGQDGVFNSGDYLMFYAESTHRWEYGESMEYEFKRHHYSDTASYFITNNLTDLR